MKKLLLLFLVVSFISAKAQITFVQSNPVNGSTNVGLSDTVSVTFSAALDTTKKFKEGNYLFTNLGPDPQIWYSADLKTVYLKSDLQPQTNYFLLFHDVFAADGSRLQNPVLIEFTTDSVFNGYSVSGSVSFEDTSIPKENTLVALLADDLSHGNPVILYAGISDSNGNFSINHVPNGTYFPVGAKDMNNDGMIDPGFGDLIGGTDSIVVNNADVTGINILLTSPEPVNFQKAKFLADSVKNADLPNDALLYFVDAYSIDSLARSDEWNFKYISDSTSLGYSVTVSIFGSYVDTMDANEFNWISNMRPLADSLMFAADPDSFVAMAENAGGYDFRTQHHPDSLTLEVNLKLGDVTKANFGDIVPNQNKFYWGLEYQLVYDDGQNWNVINQLRFLGDFETGQLIQLTGIENSGNSGLPDKFELEQNYPNPFNPTTTIQYTVPVAVKTLHATSQLVQLKIYDVLGRELVTLVNKQQSPGNYSVTFNASNLPSGIYLYELKTGNNIQVKKMMLLK